MVQRIFFVIQFTLVSKGIVSIKQDVVQRPGDREDAGQTNCAKRLQPIGVLDNFRLRALWGNTGTETVRFNRMINGWIAVARKIGE
ncbi:Uncharacterised protein [Raoultella ornithinolytica]|nr:Uncharacterised protein [Raoultella ornithinolytica]